MDLKHLAIELWERRRTLTIIVLGALVVNIFLSCVLLGGMVPKLNRDRSLLVQRTARVENAPNGAGHAHPLAKTRLEKFYGQIPGYEKFPDFLKQLYQYSRDAGLKIDRITYRPEQTDLRTVLSYAMDFSVKGRYRQIKEFLQALESWPQLVVVEQVRLAGQDPDRDEVVLSIRLTAYFTMVSS